MQELNEAYQVLKSREKRAQHDQERFSKSETGFEEERRKREEGRRNESKQRPSVVKQNRTLNGRNNPLLRKCGKRSSDSSLQSHAGGKTSA
jgi:curved DNA-binding protein CbpA